MRTGHSNIFIKASLAVLGFLLVPSFAFAAISAGGDKSITWPTLTVVMSGSVSGENVANTAWSMDTGQGPGQPTFSPPTGSGTPTVTFPDIGTYIVKYCSWNTGQCDTATVTVNLPTPSLTFDTTRPDCGARIWTGISNGGPNAAIHYDWTNSQGATWYNFDTQLDNSMTNASGNMINGPFPKGTMSTSAGWVKDGNYSVRVRTKKNGLVSPWSSAKSFTFCSTPKLQIKQGNGAWFSGSGVVFNCTSPLYTRISNAPANVRMFFRWTSSQGTFYESTQFNATQNPTTSGGGSVDSGPFPDSGGPTVPPWTDGGFYTVEAWSPGGSSSDTQSFTLRCSVPPLDCPGGAAKTCSGVQQNQYRCTSGLGREQCLNTSGLWCWQTASSCSSGQSCTGGSCVTPSGPSCSTHIFQRPPSGFYNTAGASIISIARNTTFDILCNYTVGTDDIGIIPVTADAPQCGWLDFVGTSARFRCNGGIATAGTYAYKCKIGGNIPPATANSCYQDNSIGSITVTTTSPVPGCSNAWNSTSGGTYDRDGAASRCQCDSWDRCGNYNGPFSPSPDPWCSPRPAGCPLIPVAGQSDLIVTNHWTDPSSIMAGNLVDFGAVVRNQSSTVAPGIITQTTLCLDVGSSTIGTCDLSIGRNTSNLAPNTSEHEDWTNIWTAVVGTHTYRICTDAAAVVAESNESNNCVTRSFTVTAGPPLPTRCNLIYPDNKFHVCFFDGTGAPEDDSFVLAQEDKGPLVTPITNQVGDHSGAIDQNWGAGVVTPTTKSDSVSAVWRAKINFLPGVYTFHVNSDDGVALHISGQTPATVITTLSDPSPSVTDRRSAPITIAGGPTNVRVRWFEDGGDAKLKLWWDHEPLGPLPSALPTVELISPPNDTEFDTPLDGVKSMVTLGSDVYEVIPVDLNWEFTDSAGGEQSHRRVYITDISNPESNPCVVNGEPQFSSVCADLVVDFGNSMGSQPENRKEISTPAGDVDSDLTVFLKTNSMYAWTVRGRSSVDNDDGTPRRSDRSETGIFVFATGAGREGGGDLHVERIDRQGAPASNSRAWIATRTTPRDSNPTEFTGIKSDEYPVIAYVTDKEGYTERARWCRYNRGATECPISVASLANPTDPEANLMICDSEKCFAEDIPVRDERVTRVRIMYVPECSDGLDTDDVDADVDEDDAGCLDGDGNYNPNDINEGDEGGSGGGDFTLVHDPLRCDPHPSTPEDFTTCKPGPEHPHFFSDTQIGDTSSVSTRTILTVRPTGAYTGNVTLRLVGMCRDDDLPYGEPDGNPECNSLVPSEYLRPLFGASGTPTKIVPAGGTMEFRVSKFPELSAGRYMLKIEGTAPGITKTTELLLVVGRGTSGYVPR